VALSKIKELGNYQITPLEAKLENYIAIKLNGTSLKKLNGTGQKNKIK